ncbi:MAG: hypothetical protein K2M98_08235, partial [Muribaculum sp.]|nr:hypothetical protein [Muribaculum sp.]
MEMSDLSSAELNTGIDQNATDTVSMESEQATEATENRRMTRVEILERLTEISASDDPISRDEVSR